MSLSGAGDGVAVRTRDLSDGEEVTVRVFDNVEAQSEWVQVVNTVTGSPLMDTAWI